MPRPRSLTSAQLAAAALAVIDRDGLSALTMRAVAKELGMSTMGLYRYVEGRDELEALVVELVLGTVDTTPPPGGPWQERVETLVDRLRAAVRAHPAAIPLTVVHRQRAPSGLRWSEAVLAVLAEQGVDGRHRVVALRSLLSYIIGAIQLDHLGSLAGAGTVAIAGLSVAEFPLMSETAGQARGIGADEEFRAGLRVVLHGLAELVPRSP